MRIAPFHKSARRRISAGIVILATASLLSAIIACNALVPPNKSKATPTPTRQINAIEVGIGTPADKRNWQVWKGTIVSQTSRKYLSNGSLVNTCETDWTTDFLFTIDPAGNVSGIGSANLTSGPACSPHPISGNTTYMVISVSGRKDETAIYLQLGVSEFRPMPSGDFGGYILLNSNGACPPTTQSITVPLTSSTTAQTQLVLSAVLTGCAGSKDDQMSNQSQVELHFDFLCADNPLAPSDPNAKICE